MTSPSRIVPDFLARLSRALPAPPASHCKLRYRGDDRAVELSALGPSDREAVKALYVALTDFDALLRASAVESDEARLAVRLAQSFPLDRVLSVARSIGSAAERFPDDVRRALHDVRGGALTSLLIVVQRTAMGHGELSLRALRTLTSDHLKVIRSAIDSIDEEQRAADLVPRSHSVARLAETLLRVTADGPRGGVGVSVHCSFAGAITLSCMELGALDRAVLNVVNNAVRHSVEDRVDVALVHASSDPGGDLRVLVANSVENGLADALRVRFGDDLARIFVDPFTTTGSGDGLKICVDLVSSAYGLARVEDTVRSGLVGAVFEEARFVAWMHWPAVT